MQPFCIATGNFWRLAQKSQNQSDILRFVKQFSCDGIEITFSRNEQLYKFKPDKSDLDFLSSKETVSLHAPFNFSSGCKTEDELEKNLEQLQFITKQTHAKRIVIHPNQMPPKKMLKKFRLPVITENMRKKNHVTQSTLEKIMQTTGCGLCLDVGHAYSFDRNEANRLVHRFKNKIQQLHLHSVYRNKDHRQFQQPHTKTYLQSLAASLALNVPIVMEEEFTHFSVPLIRREIEKTRLLIQASQ